MNIESSPRDAFVPKEDLPGYDVFVYGDELLAMNVGELREELAQLEQQMLALRTAHGNTSLEEWSAEDKRLYTIDLPHRKGQVSGQLEFELENQRHNEADTNDNIH